MNKTKKRRFAAQVADILQTFYESNRVPETWGTPTVSSYVFQALRNKGFGAAGTDLFRRLRKVGKPELSTWQKFTALVFGVMMVALANTFLKGEERPKVTRREIRQFSPN